MTPEDANAKRADLHLLDVREDDEWSAGHIDGAQHIPMREVPDRLAELPRDRTIVAVCRSGSRSAKVTDLLKARGYQAENLEGGTQAWAKAALPIVDTLGAPGRVI